MYINAYIWILENGTDEAILPGRNGDADVESRLVDTAGKNGGQEMSE